MTRITISSLLKSWNQTYKKDYVLVSSRKISISNREYKRATRGCQLMSPSNISQSGNHHKSYFMYWMLILNDMEIFFILLHFLASKSVNFFDNIHMCLSIFSSSLNLVFYTPAIYVCISWKQEQNILKRSLYNQKQGGIYNL